MVPRALSADLKCRATKDTVPSTTASRTLIPPLICRAGEGIVLVKVLEIGDCLTIAVVVKAARRRADAERADRMPAVFSPGGLAERV
jgi:hypothetical protein